MRRHLRSGGGHPQDAGPGHGRSATFDIARQIVQARITSVRKLDWDSMVNFFMILSPALLERAPQTLITAYHQPAAGAQARQPPAGATTKEP
jgi:predicted lysophospholipase L1 biosynthesis ABC-type transport system permease subunit